MNEGIKRIWWVLNDLMVPGSKAKKSGLSTEC
jgi:hypothetical protein